MTTYTIWLSSPTNQRLAVVDQFVRLEYRRSSNDSGHAAAAGVENVLPLRLLLRAAALPLRQIGRDTRLQIWRTVPGSGDALARTQELDTGATWFVRRVRRLLTDEGEYLVELGALPAIDLLNTRIVAYPANSAQASKSGPADDLMKAVVRENFGTLATDQQREISDWLDVAPDLGLAPVVSKSFARRSVLHVLHELAAASAEAGTPLYFDIVSPTSDRLEFRTYIGTRGTNNTFPGGVSPRILSPEAGTLSQAIDSLDYEDEHTVVYAAGQGAETERQQVIVSDAARLAASPFARREQFVDARHVRDLPNLTAEAQAALAAGQPRRAFRATITSTPGMAYGQHWRWGDRVTAAFQGDLIDCQIDEVQVIVEGGRETVRATLRAEGTMLSGRRGTPAALVNSSETEATYQQVQRGTLPPASVLELPPGGQMLTYGRYTVAGRLILTGESRLVILV
jgi:hypothetical protein